jgi:hypothetical protein
MTNAKKWNKHITSIILVAILLSSAYIGIGTVSAFKSGTTPASADYATFEGTAANDSYSSMQYSYKINEWLNTAANTANFLTGDPGKITYSYLPSSVNFNAGKSLRISMTEFGEFASIDSVTGASAGIAYGANSAEWAKSESWADAADVSPNLWIQGWTFYLNYTRGLVGGMRAVEAWATYSSASAAAESGRAVYSWDGTKYATTLSSSAFKQGSLGTSGVEVLYDSARLVVGRTTVTIYDNYYVPNEALAQITFTIIFQKDTKYAIIYKDIKILLTPKDLQMINDFAFSERYELDLAANINPSLASYVHYYASNMTSVYQNPLTGSNKVDILQAYNSARNYTYFAGYWPNATEYSVQAPSLVPNLVSPVSGVPDTSILNWNTAVPDLVNPPEPKLPQIVVQWRYNSTTGQWPNMLNFLASGDTTGTAGSTAVREFRVVEVAGMTDYNTASATSPNYAQFRAQDAQDLTANKNEIDGEVYYLLSQVFNPEDLTAALTGSLTTSYIGAPAQWVSVGQTSAATDSAGASMMSAIYSSSQYAPLALFDTNNSLPSNSLQVGTIPYGLATNGTTSNYVSTVSNFLGGTGTDATLYQRLGLTNFAFGTYDGVTTTPQPIAGGYATSSYWYPSKDPLTERWNSALTSMVGYLGFNSNPNGIINVGGEKANGLARYFNDFNFAIDREGTSGVYYTLANNGVQTGLLTPTSSLTLPTLDFFPLSTWNTSTLTGPISTFGYTNGYAMISVARDINGTRGITVAGWDARDTYWASAWASQYLKAGNTAWVPAGTVAIILNIAYSSVNKEPTQFTVVKALGTITEFGTNIFALQYGFDLRTGPATWSATSALTPITSLPTYPAGTNPWWYAKLPTTSTAKIDFDP